MKTTTTTDTGVMPFYFGLVTAKFYETWDFYTEGLGFRTWEEDDHYVVLAHSSGARLSILRHETNEQHAELVSATDGRGLWLNLEVADVDAMYEQLCAAGVPVVQPLEAGPRGARFFVVRDPNGVLLRVARVRAGLEIAI
jgi:catechol 2,3-dioxygenase-like lactoylglutathione lyase family enzyme